MSSILKYMFLILMFLAVSGCTGMINQTGRYHYLLSHHTSREEVRATLGTPIKSSADMDVFNVRGKIYDESRAEVNMMTALFLFGAWEAVALPVTIVRLPFECFCHHDLIVYYYDSDGTQVVGSSVVDLFEGKKIPNQQVEPTLKSSVDSVNTNFSAAHP